MGGSANDASAAAEATERDPNERLQEVLNYLSMSYDAEKAFAGTCVFDVPKSATNPHIKFWIRCNPKNKEQPVTTGYGMPPDGKYDTYTTMTKDDFFYLYSGKAGPAAVSSMVLTGRIKVKWFKYHELASFAGSFVYTTAQWMKYYRKYNMQEEGEKLLEAAWKRLGASDPTLTSVPQVITEDGETVDKASLAPEVAQALVEKGRWYMAGRPAVPAVVQQQEAAAAAPAVAVASAEAAAAEVQEAPVPVAVAAAVAPVAEEVRAAEAAVAGPVSAVQEEQPLAAAVEAAPVPAVSVDQAEAVVPAGERPTAVAPEEVALAPAVPAEAAAAPTPAEATADAAAVVTDAGNVQVEAAEASAAPAPASAAADDASVAAGPAAGLVAAVAATGAEAETAPEAAAERSSEAPATAVVSAVVPGEAVSVGAQVQAEAETPSTAANVQAQDTASADSGVLAAPAAVAVPAESADAGAATVAPAGAAAVPAVSAAQAAVTPSPAPGGVADADMRVDALMLLPDLIAQPAPTAKAVEASGLRMLSRPAAPSQPLFTALRGVSVSHVVDPLMLQVEVWAREVADKEEQIADNAELMRVLEPSLAAGQAGSGASSGGFLSAVGNAIRSAGDALTGSDRSKALDRLQKRDALLRAHKDALRRDIVAGLETCSDHLRRVQRAAAAGTVMALVAAGGYLSSAAGMGAGPAGPGTSDPWSTAGSSLVAQLSLHAALVGGSSSSPVHLAVRPSVALASTGLASAVVGGLPSWLGAALAAADSSKRGARRCTNSPCMAIRSVSGLFTMPDDASAAASAVAAGVGAGGEGGSGGRVWAAADTPLMAALRHSTRLSPALESILLGPSLGLPPSVRGSLASVVEGVRLAAPSAVVGGGLAGIGAGQEQVDGYDARQHDSFAAVAARVTALKDRLLPVQEAVAPVKTSASPTSSGGGTSTASSLLESIADRMPSILDVARTEGEDQSGGSMGGRRADGGAALATAGAELPGSWGAKARLQAAQRQQTVPGEPSSQPADSAALAPAASASDDDESGPLLAHIQSLSTSFRHAFGAVHPLTPMDTLIHRAALNAGSGSGSSEGRYGGPAAVASDRGAAPVSDARQRVASITARQQPAGSREQPLPALSLPHGGQSFFSWLPGMPVLAPSWAVERDESGAGGSHAAGTAGGGIAPTVVSSTAASYLRGVRPGMTWTLDCAHAETAVWCLGAPLVPFGKAPVRLAAMEITEEEEGQGGGSDGSNTSAATSPTDGGPRSPSLSPAAHPSPDVTMSLLPLWRPKRLAAVDKPSMAAVTAAVEEGSNDDGASSPRPAAPPPFTIAMAVPVGPSQAAASGTAATITPALGGAPQWAFTTPSTPPVVYNGLGSGVYACTARERLRIQSEDALAAATRASNAATRPQRRMSTSSALRRLLRPRPASKVDEASFARYALGDETLQAAGPPVSGLVDREAVTAVLRDGLRALGGRVKVYARSHPLAVYTADTESEWAGTGPAGAGGGSGGSGRQRGRPGEAQRPATAADAERRDRSPSPGFGPDFDRRY